MKTILQKLFSLFDSATLEPNALNFMLEKGSF